MACGVLVAGVGGGLMPASRAWPRAVLRRNQPRMFSAIADTPVAAKRGLPAVRTLISRAASGADNAACAVAFRAVDRVALVSDCAVLKRVAIIGGGYAAAGCGGVAVADIVAEAHVVLAVVTDLLSRNEIVDSKLYFVKWGEPGSYRLSRRPSIGKPLQ